MWSTKSYRHVSCWLRLNSPEKKPSFLRTWMRWCWCLKRHVSFPTNPSAIGYASKSITTRESNAPENQLMIHVASIELRWAVMWIKEKNENILRMYIFRLILSSLVYFGKSSTLAGAYPWPSIYSAAGDSTSIVIVRIQGSSKSPQLFQGRGIGDYALYCSVTVSFSIAVSSPQAAGQFVTMEPVRNTKSPHDISLSTHEKLPPVAVSNCFTVLSEGKGCSPGNRASIHHWIGIGVPYHPSSAAQCSTQALHVQILYLEYVRISSNTPHFPIVTSSCIAGFWNYCNVLFIRQSLVFTGCRIFCTWGQAVTPGKGSLVSCRDCKRPGEAESTVFLWECRSGIKGLNTNRPWHGHHLLSPAPQSPRHKNWTSYFT